MRGLGIVYGAVAVLFAGCAGVQRPDRAQDFPRHAADHPFVDLHWRLDRGQGEAQAVGLVEATRQGSLWDVVVELRGIDKDGRVVSRGLGRTLGGTLNRWEGKPFTVRVRLTGQEERFELGVWSYTWTGSGTTPPDVAVRFRDLSSS